MKLPKREFYTVHDVAARWGYTIADVAGWSVAGHFDRQPVKVYAWDVVNEAFKDSPDNPADWAFMSKYSPYHNIKDGTAYPETQRPA